MKEASSCTNGNDEVTTTLTVNQKKLLASYFVAWKIAKSMKPSTDGRFVKSCVVGVAEIMCPEQVDNFSNIHLSPNTVKRRIENIYKLIVNEIDVNVSHFISYSLALDECTDINDKAQLAIFIRGVSEDLSVHEYLLDLITLKESTTGYDLFQALKSVIENKNLDLTKLVSVVTDGAPAMTGEKKGLVGHLKKLLENMELSEVVKYFHCIIHQQVLWSKVVNMEHVMNVVVHTINKIKSSALKHRKFRKLLEDLEKDHEDLPFYTEVRWLSRGKMLRRFFYLRSVISNFMISLVRFCFFTK